MFLAEIKPSVDDNLQAKEDLTRLSEQVRSRDNISNNYFSALTGDHSRRPHALPPTLFYFITDGILNCLLASLSDLFISLGILGMLLVPTMFLDGDH